MYCQRIDIVFDLYVQNSIKQGERDRKKKALILMSIVIISRCQLKWKVFGHHPKIKRSFKCFLSVGSLKLTRKKNHGSLPEHLIRCIRICSGESFSCRSLQCDHEEADDRLLHHIHHAVRVENF